MPSRPVVRMGHPVLRRRAIAIADPTDPLVASLLADMVETMFTAGGIGLAAPQVAEGVRAIVWRPIDNRAEVGAAPAAMVLVNPELVVLDETRELGWEGCLSIPELRGLVPRYTRIGISGTAPDGSRIERELNGLQARIVQHEVDHLDGILYLDRMTDLASLGYVDALAEAARNGDAPMPFPPA